MPHLLTVPAKRLTRNSVGTGEVQQVPERQSQLSRRKRLQAEAAVLGKGGIQANPSIREVYSGKPHSWHHALRSQAVTPGNYVTKL